MGRTYVGGGSGIVETGGGGGGGGVSSVSGASPIESSGGPDPIISLALPGQTEGDILYFDGTAWTRLPAGMPGQILSTQGVGGPPLWQAAPSSGSVATFVYQPGGTAGGNVYIDWHALYAALNMAAPLSVNGNRSPTTISVDDTFVAPAHAVIPAGAYNLDGVTFTSPADGAAAANSGGAFVDFAIGVTLTVPTHGLTLRFAGGGQYNYLDATPCITVAAGQYVVVAIHERTTLQCSGAGAFVSAPAGEILVESNNGIIGDPGAHTVFAISAAGVAALRGYANTHINPGACSGAGFNLFWDSFIPGSPQGAGVVITQVDGYVPAVPGNWNPVPNAQSPALDQLAARPSPVVPNASWAQADWYVDPVAGNDANSGAIGFPVKTIQGGIVSKWGTLSPTIKQNTTIHLLKAETLSQEDAVLEPVLVEGVWFAIVGTPLLVAAFQLGVVTPKNRVTPQLLTSTGFVAGGIAVGCLVVNTDRGNSEAMIQALAAGTATLSQPLAPLTPAVNASNLGATPAEVDTWAHLDHVSVYALPLLNLKVFQAAGGDTTAASLGGVSWAQYVHIPDVSGVPGNSYYPAGPDQGCIGYYVSCLIDPYVTFAGTEGGGIDGGQLIGCALTAGGSIENASFIGGYANTFGLSLDNRAGVDADCILETLDTSSSMSFVGLCYVHTLCSAFNGSTLKLDPLMYGAAILWGPAALNAQDNGVIVNQSGTSWASAILLTGLLTLNEVETTGSTQFGGYWLSNIPITTANLDTYYGLQDPNSGARYSDIRSISGNLTPPTWFQTDWYVDPVGGLDTNPGTIGSPVQTITGGVVARWGTRSPTLTQTTTIHLVHPEPLGLESTILEPTLVGGVNFVIVGTPTATGAPFTGGGLAVVPKSRTFAAPSPLQLTGAPGGFVVGTLLHNTTKDSYAFIDDIAGGTTLIMTQPFFAASLLVVGPSAIPVEDDTWASTDTYQALTLPLLNLKYIRPVGGDTTSLALANPVFWVQWVTIPDVSGLPGASSFTADGVGGCIPVFNSCRIEPFFNGNGTAGAFLPGQCLNCWMGGGFYFTNWFGLGGSGNTRGSSPFDGCFITDFSALDGDILCHGGVTMHGGQYCFFSYVYIDGTTDVAGGQVRIEGNYYGAGAACVYGPSSLDVDGGGALINENGTTWVACLTLNGGLSLSGVATGSSFNPGAAGNPYTPGIAITAATLDANGGLQNPANGDRYSFA